MTELSKRAQKVLARIEAGHFYEVYGQKARKSLDELLAAGLITGGCRAVTLGAYYVPATGYVRMQCERFESDAEGYATALVRETAPELLAALKALYQMAGRALCEEYRDALHKARTAIAKAEGKAS